MNDLFVAACASTGNGGQDAQRGGVQGNRVGQRRAGRCLRTSSGRVMSGMEPRWPDRLVATLPIVDPSARLPAGIDHVIHGATGQPLSGGNDLGGGDA